MEATIYKQYLGLDKSGNIASVLNPDGIAFSEIEVNYEQVTVTAAGEGYVTANRDGSYVIGAPEARVTPGGLNKKVTIKIGNLKCVIEWSGDSTEATLYYAGLLIMRAIQTS